MSWKPAFPEGITLVQRADIMARHCDDTLRAARSLKEMTADWAFFTVGCIYTYGGLDHNVIAEYTQAQPDHDCCVMSLRSGRPIFTGMCTPGWLDKTRRIEHELCAVPLEYWDGLRDRLSEISMVDRKKGRFARTTIQELDIVDFLAVANALVPSIQIPTLTITAFGIDGTHHHVVFAPQTTGPHDTVRVVKMPIREETRQMGQAILAGKNPFTTPLLPLAAQADVAQKVKEAEEKS